MLNPKGILKNILLSAVLPALLSVGFFAASLPVATPSAKAENLTWLVKSRYPYKVSVSFYSKWRNHSWPGGTKVWVISDSSVHEYTLSCRRGEKICMGAWVRGNKRKYWGVGYRGRKGCRKCCYTCNGGETRIQTLRR